MGARTKPVAGKIFEGKIEIPADAVFNVNAETGDIKVDIAGNVYPIGEKLVYINKSLEK